MPRPFTPTEDRFLVIGSDWFGVPRKILADLINRHPGDIAARLRILQDRERTASFRPSGFPRKSSCMTPGCGAEIMRQHSGHRHCDPCRGRLSSVSPLAPDIYADGEAA